MRIKKLWTFLPAILLILIGISLWLNFKHHTSLSPGKSMEIWAHRGEHVNFPENSKSAVDQAFNSGFAGVEIDVFFDEDYGLIVSHEKPYTKVDGKLVTLQEVIYGYDPSFSFWLDFKNLKIRKLKEIKRALNTVFEKEDGLIERTYIESGNGRALRRLNSDFKCIYWVQFNRTGIRGIFKLYAVKLLMAVTNFEGITTDHRYIDQKFTAHFKNKRWYIFTVNETEELEKLKLKAEACVVLTDLSFEEIKDVLQTGQ